MNRNRSQSGIPAGTLLADHATTITTTAGPCAICGRAMLPGERVARLAVAATGRAHAHCTAAIIAAPPATGRRN